MKTVCRVATAGITLLSVREILTRSKSYDELVKCFKDCVLPAGTQLIRVTEGCVCCTVQADNLKGLITLWNMYQDGTLKARLFDLFVTAEMKIFAGGIKNMEFTVTIDKKEYEKACIELIDESEGN